MTVKELVSFLNSNYLKDDAEVVLSFGEERTEDKLDSVEVVYTEDPIKGWEQPRQKIRLTSSEFTNIGKEDIRL